MGPPTLHGLSPRPSPQAAILWNRVPLGPSKEELPPHPLGQSWASLSVLGPSEAWPRGVCAAALLPFPSPSSLGDLVEGGSSWLRLGGSQSPVCSWGWDSVPWTGLPACRPGPLVRLCFPALSHRPQFSARKPRPPFVPFFRFPCPGRSCLKNGAGNGTSSASCAQSPPAPPRFLPPTALSLSGGTGGSPPFDLLPRGQAKGREAQVSKQSSIHDHLGSIGGPLPSTIDLAARNTIPAKEKSGVWVLCFPLLHLLPAPLLSQGLLGL